jgi:hypothetical protein
MVHHGDWARGAVTGPGDQGMGQGSREWVGRSRANQQLVVGGLSPLSRYNDPTVIAPATHNTVEYILIRLHSLCVDILSLFL